jgi:hypothetical protein
MIRAPRQDDVAGRGVAAHVDFRAFETVFGRQADGLAAAIAEEFGGLCHDIYHGIYRQRGGIVNQRYSPHSLAPYS